MQIENSSSYLMGDEETQQGDYGVRKNGLPKKKPGRKPKSMYHFYSVFDLRRMVGQHLGAFNGLCRMPKPVLVSICDWIKEDKRKQFDQKCRKRAAKEEAARLKREKRLWREQHPDEEEEEDIQTGDDEEEEEAEEEEEGDNSATDALVSLGGVAQKVNTLPINPK